MIETIYGPRLSGKTAMARTRIASEAISGRFETWILDPDGMLGPVVPGARYYGPRTSDRFLADLRSAPPLAAGAHLRMVNVFMPDVYGAMAQGNTAALEHIALQGRWEEAPTGLRLVVRDLGLGDFAGSAMLQNLAVNNTVLRAVDDLPTTGPHLNPRQP